MSKFLITFDDEDVPENIKKILEENQTWILVDGEKDLSRAEILSVVAEEIERKNNISNESFRGGKD